MFSCVKNVPNVRRNVIEVTGKLPTWGATLVRAWTPERLVDKHAGVARFGVRWSFLCLFWRFPSDIRVQDKAAEVSLLDAGATFAIPLDIGEAFGVRLSFLALWVRDMFLRAANHNAPMQKRQKR